MVSNDRRSLRDNKWVRDLVARVRGDPRSLKTIQSQDPITEDQLKSEIIQMKLIIFGPPLAGKGTQAKLIAENFKIPHLSAGQLLREAVRSGTTMGTVVGDFMSSGTLVPDRIVMQLMGNRLKDDDCRNGYILDGFPRTLFQAEEFHKDNKVDKVINISVEDDMLVQRIVGRRTCRECGAIYHVESNPPKVENKCDLCDGALYLRSDDRADVLKNRLNIYHEETKHLIYFYKSMNVLVDIDGNQDINDIYKAIESHLK
jgi:adenylate kinase